MAPSIEQGAINMEALSRVVISLFSAGNATIEPGSGAAYRARTMPRLSVRIDLDGGQRIGPGKIALLKAIGETGSISAAGRALRMSYRRAWTLIEELNESFGKPLVKAQTGGKRGGGAGLTPLGKAVVAHYTAIETKSHKAATRHLGALQATLRGKR
jgi:molybdate transport system regulatory protein